MKKNKIKIWLTGIRKQLLLLAIIPLAVLGFVFLKAYSSIHKLQEKVNYSYQVRAKLIEQVGDMNGSIHAIGRWVWITYGMSSDPEAQKKFIGFAKTELLKFEETKNEYDKMPRSENIVLTFKKVDELWPKTKAGVEESLTEFSKHTPESNEEAKKILQAKVLPNLVPITKTLEEIHTLMDHILEKEIVDTEVEVQNEIRTLFLSGLVGVLFLIFYSTWTATQLANKLSDISLALQETSEQVAASSTQIASAAQGLAQATTEQASSLQETSTSLEQISSMIAKTSDNSNFTSTTSATTQEKAEQGQKVVHKMLSSIDQISQSNDSIVNQMNTSNQQMSAIVSVIQNIGEKTKVINDIVFQTKLLSFNASVEAARAGEHGKGFAVVAEEVGKLAQMSGNASKEISDMLNESITSVTKIVEDTKRNVSELASQSKKKIDEGKGITQQCNDVFNEILQNVNKVAELATEISVASSEQSQGVNEINKAMAQLDSVTQLNSSTSEEASIAATSLAVQATALNDRVHDLISIIDGQSRHQNKALTNAKTEAKHQMESSLPNSNLSNLSVTYQNSEAA